MGTSKYSGIIVFIAVSLVVGRVLSAQGIGIVQPLPAAAPASAPASSPTDQLGQYAPMAKALSLSDEQLGALKEKVAGKQKAMAAFMKEDGEAWGEAMRASTGDGDEKTRDQAAAKVKELQAKWDALLSEQESLVMSVLTPQQRLAWDELSLTEKMTVQFSAKVIGHDASGAMSVQLTPPGDAQIKIIKEACAKAAKELQAFKNPYDSKQRQEISDKLAADLKAKLPAAGQGSEEK